MDTMLKRPVSALGNRRPMSRFSRDMALEEPMNPRYRCDNILIVSYNCQKKLDLGSKIQQLNPSWMFFCWILVGSPTRDGNSIMEYCYNILSQLELELPTRTTRDWEGPDPDGQGLLSLENGGEPEADEMVIQASPGVFRSSVSNRQKSTRNQRSAREKVSREHSSLKSSENFPKSRGLVPR